MDSLSHCFTTLRQHNQNSFFLHNFFCFLFQAAGYLETCVNGVTNCKTSKRVLVPLLPGEMKLDLRRLKGPSLIKGGPSWLLLAPVSCPGKLLTFCIGKNPPLHIQIQGVSPEPECLIMSRRSCRTILLHSTKGLIPAIRETIIGRFGDWRQSLGGLVIGDNQSKLLLSPISQSAREEG